jgi:hypothetical protein
MSVDKKPKFHIEPATDGKHKYVGIFEKEDGHVTKIPFGAKGYEDLTTHKNVLRRQRYIARHKAREDWKNPMSAGALSRWILWETPELEKNIRIFKQKFNLE